jgi:hypothetical protein
MSFFSSRTKKNLAQQAVKYGFDIRDVDAQGNCFYASIAHQLQQTNLWFNHFQQKNVRNSLATEMINHKEYYQYYLEKESVDNFIKAQLEDGNWVDHADLVTKALSRYFNINIVMLGASKEAIVNKRDNPLTTIYIGFEDRHYVSLVSSGNIHPALQSIIDKAEIDEEGYVVKDVEIKGSRTKLNHN